MLYACDGLIYDGEGDCSVSYRVKFRYDYNMKFADAFAREVNTVTLYLLDAEGRVVWQRTEQGEALSADGGDGDEAGWEAGAEFLWRDEGDAAALRRWLERKAAANS